MPVRAACLHCQLKFLTPSGMMNQGQAAKDYLWDKYINHRCAANSGRETDDALTSRSGKQARAAPRGVGAFVNAGCYLRGAEARLKTGSSTRRDQFVRRKSMASVIRRP